MTLKTEIAVAVLISGAVITALITSFSISAENSTERAERHIAKLVPYYEINEDCTAYHYYGNPYPSLVICKQYHPTLK